MNIQLYCLSLWDPLKEKIRKKYFIKNEIIFGSDKDADVRLENTPGLMARLDCQTEELWFIADEKVETVKEGALFQMGEHVFQWKKINFLKTKWTRWFLMLIPGMVLLSLLCCFPVKQHFNCSEKALKIVSGSWGSSSAPDEHKAFFHEIHELKKSFEEALKKQGLMKARAELNGIKKILEKEQIPSECGGQTVLVKLEAKMSEKVARFFLKENNVLAASKELHRFKTTYASETLFSLEKRVLRSARKVYLEGYRLEEENPEKGEELMEQARQICLTLGQSSDCFRSK